MKLGNIPQKLKFFIRKPEKVSFRWDDVEGGERDFNVLPCYISDATNKKTLETGENWAKNRNYSDRNSKFETLETNNEPFTNLRVITLEIRDQGGRAYKVCADIGDKKNLYFDMREDVLLDSLFQVGIEKGGIIPGEFIFAKVGAQMKPVRVNSFLHEKMIEATQYDEKKPVADLEIGGVYRNKRGDEACYLGQYWAREPLISFEERDYYSRYDQLIKTLSFAKPRLVHVFHSHWDENDYWFHSKDDEDYYKKGEPTAYNLTIVLKHSFKEKVKNKKVPEGYVELVKEKIIKRYCEPKKLERYPKMSVNGLFGQQAKLLTLSLDKDYVHPMLKEYTK